MRTTTARVTRSTAPLLTLLLLGTPAPLEAQARTGHAPLPSVELPAELDRVLRNYERLWAAGDGNGLAELFTGDGFVRADAGWIRGREGIAARYAGAGDLLRLRAIEYAVDGSVGWIVGAYGYGVAEVDRGSFLLALRLGEDGRWRIAADLDHTIRPAEPGG